MFPYPPHYRLALPPLLTTSMVVWSLLSRLIFGDELMLADHAVGFFPLFMLFPLILLLHGQLIWESHGMDRLDQATYALIHICLSFVVWTFSLMYINGNAFS